MNSAERKARADGYEFTGIYERDYDRERAKERAVKIRKQGFKARLVQGNSGVSVYAEKKYFAQKYLDSANSELAAIEKRREWAMREYESAMEIIAQREEWLKESIVINQSILDGEKEKNTNEE